MKLAKRFLGISLSAVLLASQAVPAMAADPTSTAGTGNMLAYNVETVIVPTTIKIALNPNTYDITTKYIKATTYNAAKTYYADANGTALSSQPADAEAFAAGTFYEAVTSNLSVVSLNYGIANKSSRAKTVDVSVKADYTTADDKTAITLVDAANKAQAYDADTNDEGAKTGELKMFLALASAQAAPTADTYQKTADTALVDNKKYYTKGGTEAAPTYAEVASPDVANIKTYYEATTTIGTEVTATLLSDVNMSIARAGVQAFPAFTKGETKSESTGMIAYGLNEATYTPKDGEIIDFNTNQTTLAGKLEMSALGDVAGFTLTGAINPLADWTTADATAITFTPTYKVTDATGSEEAAASGAYKQIKTGPQISMTSAGLITISNLTADQNYVDLQISFTKGDNDETYDLETDSDVTWNTSNWSAAEGGSMTCDLGNEWLSYLDGVGTVTATLSLSDETTKTVTATF